MNPQLDLSFRALGDATRRQILHCLLLHGEVSAGQIAGRFTSAQPTISKHLRVLEEAGLVLSRAQGRNRFYRIGPDALAPATDWLTRHAAMWNSSLDRLGRQLADGL